MYISSIRVHNYKSFNESDTLKLERGFNVIIGQNNVGKTALLEALSLRFTSKPHLGSKTKPKADSSINQTSKIDIAITLDRDELFDILRNLSEPFFIPVPRTISLENNQVGSNNRSPIMAHIKEIFSTPHITFNLQLHSNAAWHTPNFPTYTEHSIDSEVIHGARDNKYFFQCLFKDGHIS